MATKRKTNDKRTSNWVPSKSKKATFHVHRDGMAELIAQAFSKATGFVVGPEAVKFKTGNGGGATVTIPLQGKTLNISALP